MRKETKIAILAIVALALAIWGFKYLKGFNILSKKTAIHTVYDNVAGLKISNPVFINGLEVGLVSDIRQQANDLNQIIVTMELEPDVKVPKTATAELVTTSIMGGNAINLVFEGNCSGDGCVKNGDYLKGVTKGVLASIATPEEVGMYVKELNKGLQDVLDSVSYKLSQSEEIQSSVRDVRVILTNLRTTTDRLNNVIASSSGAIQASMRNLESVTNTLRENNQQIRNILLNADSVTTDLKNADISALAGDARLAFQKLQTTLVTSEKAIANLEAFLNNLKSGNGALSMLTNDPEFAKSLELTVKNVQLLMQDIRLHPERYRRILSKKEMPYEAPEQDPGFKN